MRGAGVSTTIRARVLATIAVGAVAVVIATGVLVVLNHDSGTADSATRATPTATAASFAPSIGGDELLAQTVGEPGQHSVTLRFVPHDRNLAMTFFCRASDPPPYMTTIRTVNGHETSGQSCGPDAQPGDSLPGRPFHSDPARNRKKLASLDVVPGQPSTITVAVPDEDQGSVPRARLGVAVYELNGPRTTVDGFVLKNIVESEGRTFRLESYAVQRVADGRQVELPIKTRAAQVAIASGADGPNVADARISLRRGGQETGTSGASGSSLAAGPRHGDTEVSLVAGSDVPDRTRLLLAVYAPRD